MSTTVEQTAPSTRKPIRVWPGIAAAVLQLLCWFVVPVVRPEAAVFGAFAGLALGLVILLWWLFFSRAPWIERIGAIVLMVLAVIISKRIVHPSIAGGMMGMMLPIFSIPVMSITLVAWATVTRPFSTGLRRVSLLAAILLACIAFSVVRTGGMSGEGSSDFHWRWTKTPEERLLAQGDEPATPATTSATTTAEGAHSDSGWPGFRGPQRDGIAHPVRIKTDWTASPPVQLWRRPVGPGWS